MCIGKYAGLFILIVMIDGGFSTRPDSTQDQTPRIATHVDRHNDDRLLAGESCLTVDPAGQTRTVGPDRATIDPLAVTILALDRNPGQGLTARRQSRP